MAYPTGYINPVALTAGSTGAIVMANTSALQTAINSTTAGPVVIPVGVYKTNPLTLISGTTIIGAGSVAEGGVETNGTSTLNLVKTAVGSTTPLITIPTDVQDILIQDVILDGGLNTNNPGANVVTVADNTVADQVNLRMERVTITNSGNYGLYVGTHRDDVKLHHCAILSSYNHGLLTKGPDGVYDACAFGENGNSAVQSGASGNNIEIQAVVNRVTNCDIWGGPGGTTTGTNIGIVVMPSMTGIVITGNGIDRHNHQGIYVDSSCYGVVIFGNVFHSNSQASKGGYSHVYNDSGTAGGVMFDGNVAIVDSGLTSASYLLGQSTTLASGDSQAGSCNYSTVTAGATQGGVETGIFGYSVLN